MPRIKIKDLPKDKKISKAEMKAVLGGTDYMNQAILPQGEDLIKPGNVQYGYLGMGQIPYLGGGRGIFGGRILIGGY